MLLHSEACQRFVQRCYAEDWLKLLLVLQLYYDLGCARLYYAKV